MALGRILPSKKNKQKKEQSLTGIDRTLPCDDRLCGGDCRKNCFGLARHPVGHEAACQMSSGRKCVAFPVAVHLIFRSAPFLLLMPVFFSDIFSQKSLPYRKQCVALQGTATTDKKTAECIAFRRKKNPICTIATV